MKRTALLLPLLLLAGCAHLASYPDPALEHGAPAAGHQEARDQESVWPEGEWRFGASTGLPGVGLRPAPQLFTLGGHAQYFPRGLLGLETSLGFAPLGLAVGGLLMGGRAGVTLPFQEDSILMLPSAGLSVLGGASRHGLQPGPLLYHVGLAGVHVSGIRLGVTVHWLDLSDEAIWLVEFGVIPL